MIEANVNSTARDERDKKDRTGKVMRTNNTTCEIRSRKKNIAAERWKMADTCLREGKGNSREFPKPLAAKEPPSLRDKKQTHVCAKQCDSHEHKVAGGKPNPVYDEKNKTQKR